MDIKKLKKSIPAMLDKYKYAAVIVVAGLALMLLPASGGSDKTPTQSKTSPVAEPSVQQQLEEILSCIAGAGSVKVMLTEDTGEETLYQFDEDRTSSESSTSVRTEVVTVTDSQRNESGLVRQVNPAKYLGVIVLCQGADDPALKLEITNAVSKITGLGADRIAVLKMK